jgi:hypothetical protein
MSDYPAYPEHAPGHGGPSTSTFDCRCLEGVFARRCMCCSHHAASGVNKSCGRRKRWHLLFGNLIPVVNCVSEKNGVLVCAISVDVGRAPPPRSPYIQNRQHITQGHHLHRVIVVLVLVVMRMPIDVVLQSPEVRDQTNYGDGYGLLQVHR